MNESELDHSQKLAIYQVQQRVLERAIRGDGLAPSMEVLCHEIERMLAGDGGLCSILLLEDGHLKHCAAPNLPEAYCQAIDGVAIGEAVGSCGTALFRQKQVVVTDIASNPLWADYRELAKKNGLRACWSNPIAASDGTPLASFAIYYPIVCSPSEFHLYLIQAVSSLALLVIDHYRLLDQQANLSRALQKINARLTAITQVIPDVAIVIDQSGYYMDFLGDTSQLISPTDTLIGKPVSYLFGHELAARIIAVIQQTIDTRQTQALEYEVWSQGQRRIFEGRTALIDNFYTDEFDSNYVLWMARDITTRKLAEEEAAHFAQFDVLTGLPNRRHMQEKLDRLLDEVNRDYARGAVMFLDIDNFKRINDSLGHQQGDELLRQVARRLQDNTRKPEMVARMGGDEFVILLKEPFVGNQALMESVSSAAHRIVGCFREMLEVEGNAYSLSTSLGIALIDRPGLTTEDLLRQADTAMYAAKRLGGNRLSFFDESLQREAHRRLDLERRMAQAISQEYFQAYFQPQVNLNGQPIGAEVLITQVSGFKLANNRQQTTVSHTPAVA